MPRRLVPCPACAELVLEGACSCPHCGEKHPCRAHTVSRAAALLGLGVALAGCPDPDKDDDPFEVGQNDYSGAVTLPDDDDGDGYNVEEDCDDADPAIYPGAPETAGDGVDSDCDGEDDT